MKINSIRTQYKNYIFRSRLEAKWANFFDLLIWKWEYEPVDFNGWIPDFAIYGADIIYIEVKPVMAFPGEVARKIFESGCDKEAIIVGQNPIGNVLGWFAMAEGDMGEDDFAFVDIDGARAILRKWDDSKVIGFHHEYNSYHDRITNSYDGCGNSAAEYDEEIQKLWAQACNNTQWKK